MIENFLQRTREHIALVAQNLEKIANHPDHREIAGELRQRASSHDASKSEEPERTPKVWAAESIRCKEAGEPFDYPPGMEARVADAERHHLSVNSHHPEYHSSPEAMSVVDVMEMVCDWTAIAQARWECDGSARCWAEKCMGYRYPFSEDQRDLIFRLIMILDSEGTTDRIRMGSF